MQLLKRVIVVCAVVALSGCATLDNTKRAKVDAYRDLGNMYLHRGQVELAIREYRKGLAVWDGDSETHFAVGEAYRQKGAFDDAERHLVRAVRLDHSLHDARLSLGALYLQNERWSDAVRESEILVADPTFLRPARALVNLGWAHYKSGNRKLAEGLFVEAVSSDTSNYQARLNLGILLYEREELVESVQQFGEVTTLLEARPAWLFGAVEAEARFRMAMAHVRLGNRHRAIEQLRVAVDRGGKTQWAEKSRDYLAVLE